jgi:hypothetical protein
MARSIAQELARLARELKEIKRGQRYAHGGSVEDAALEFRDGEGTIRAVIGMQPDGTVGLIAQNGPPPGAPSAPVITPSIGGLRVVWDGSLADGSPLPADFDHVAVHISTTSGFTPSAATFVGTITRSGEGGTLPVTPLPYQPHYVLLAAVNTSGIAGPPSVETAATPIQVAGPDLKAGSVEAAAIAAGAVTADKLEAILQLVTRLVAGNPDGARVELNENGLRVYNNTGQLVIRFDAADGSATFTGAITGSTMTGSLIQTAISGPRVTVNEDNLSKVLVYNDVTPTAIGEFSDRGLLLQGTNGAVMWLDPDSAYPNLRFTNAGQTNSAYVNVSETSPGAADLGLTSGMFTGSGFSDMKWRTFMGNDFAVIERIRNADDQYAVGGRFFLSGTSASLGYRDSGGTSQSSTLFVQAGHAFVSGGRFSVQPPASSSSAVLVSVVAGHTGNLLNLTVDGATRMSVDKDGNTDIKGIMTAGNIASGTVTVTPSAAHTPTSASVNFGPLKGTTFRGYATAVTTVPGVRTPVGAQGVTGVSVSSVTSSSMLVWVNRENTTATVINWMVIAS